MNPVFQLSRNKLAVLRALGVLTILGTSIGVFVSLRAANTPPMLAISQTPLQMVTPTRPEIVIAVGNSQSMDGTFSGAIMTGSGSIPSNYASLSLPQTTDSIYGGSSPTYYLVPSGFKPPVTPADAAGYAPYTVKTNGVRQDNSASRLNVAKAVIDNDVLQAYLATSDFALATYSVGNSPSLFSTWVYYMSPQGSNFTFDNNGPVSNPTGTSPTTTVYNPCYLVDTSYANRQVNQVALDCYLLNTNGGIPASTLKNSQFMHTGSSSDDANITDVLYSRQSSPNFALDLEWGSLTGKNSYPINPNNGSTPYIDSALNPHGWNVSDFNGGSVSVTYSGTIYGINTTSPTNAGFVPYSPQVMYAARGFGFDTGSPSAGTPIVPMTNLATNATITSSIVSAARANFSPFLKPETDQSNTGEIKSAATQSPLGILITDAKTAFDAPSAARTCTTPRYIILVTDGQPTEDSSSSNKSWPPLGTGSASALNIYANFQTVTNADGSTSLKLVTGTPVTTSPNGPAPTYDQAVVDAYNAVLALNQNWHSPYPKGYSTAPAINTATPNLVGSISDNYVFTYVIGLGAGAAGGVTPMQISAKKVLDALAYAGGTGHSYSASNEAQFKDALKAIMYDIQSHTLATVSSSSNSTHLTANSKEYQATFTSAEPQFLDWTGELYSENLNTNGTPTGTINWSAKNLLTARSPNSRAIATWYASSATIGYGLPFQPYGAPGVSSGQQTILNSNDSLGNARIAYLRGDRTSEKQNGGSFRNRTALLGDIVNSQPVYIGAPRGPYSSDPSYQTFVQNNAGRTPMLYVGANDGMVHGFRASDGGEQFAFIPNTLFSNLLNLTDPGYNFTHQYFVDATPQYADVKFTGAGCSNPSDASTCWHTLLLGGEGGGGRSIYAIDVTHPDAMNSDSAVASSILWEYNGDNSDNNMGYSYSNPIVAITSDVNTNDSANGFMVFFGNGYNAPTGTLNGKAVLYAVNPQNGRLVTSIDLCAQVSGICDTTGTRPQGLSSVSAGYSGSAGQPARTIYAGDIQGNMWAVDITNPNPVLWGVRCIFKSGRTALNNQPITAAPVVSLHPNSPVVPGFLVMFGTGQLLTSTDTSSAVKQAVYAVWDNGSTSQVTTANLKQQTMTIVTGAFAQPIATSTSDPVSWGTQMGWYSNFPTSNERVTSNLVLFSGALQFITNTPPSGSCQSNWSSFFYDLNFANGGNFGQTPQIDADNNGVLNASDLYGSGVNAVAPTGISLGGGYASGINSFGLNGIDIVTIASITDINAATNAQNASTNFFTSVANTDSTPVTSGNISSLNSTLSTLQTQFTTMIIPAITASVQANPNNLDTTLANIEAGYVSADLTALANAIAAYNSAQTASNLALVQADLNKLAADASVLQSNINCAANNCRRQVVSGFAAPNLPWWQVQ